MASFDTNLADRSGSLIESHKNYQPRVVLFYFLIALMLGILACDLAYQQLFRSDFLEMRGERQNLRRIVMPGPRGDILDREGKVLVGNSAPWSLVVYLDELRPEFLSEARIIHKDYVASADKNKAILAQLPTVSQYNELARWKVMQHYLDQIGHILGRELEVDKAGLEKHFSQELLLPYVLLSDLTRDETARLFEQIPVNSPLQVYPSTMRTYPYGSAAAHTIGRVKRETEVSIEDFPKDYLRTFKATGTAGLDGLEKQFDSILQGQAGGTILQVDPAGYRINKPLESRPPVKGQNLTTSIDIDLQLAAEKAIDEGSDGQATSLVAMDVNTGEVLVLASKPDYNLNDVSPRMSTATSEEIEKAGGWYHRAVNGAYPPGSTFKILVSIAGMRAGTIDPDAKPYDCEGTLHLGSLELKCYNGKEQHGFLDLREAITHSCDIYFDLQGLKMGPDVMAAEAKRFHLDQRTGIELPETNRMNIPTKDWKRLTRKEAWVDGDTANMSIGQGDVLVTPLQMASFAASVARNETYTKPTLIHNPNAPAQHTEAIGLTPAQRAALLEGMWGCTTIGTAKILASKLLVIPGLDIAGKTGTAQITGKKNVAWFICFAPLEKPEIAIAVAVEGDTAGQETQGGLYAAPMAAKVLKAWWEKRNNPQTQAISIGGR